MGRKGKLVRNPRNVPISARIPSFVVVLEVLKARSGQDGQYIEYFCKCWGRALLIYLKASSKVYVEYIAGIPYSSTHFFIYVTPNLNNS